MDRVLEPEYMDTEEEAQEYDSMDHASANDSFVEAVLAAGAAQRSRALDLGTGPGDIPILLARAVPGLQFVAVDAAQTMLDIAAHKVAGAGLADRIQLQQADVKKLPFADGSFDLVFSNTILHHIPEPLDMLREARRVLSDQGVLVLRDLYRPATLAEAEGLVDLHARDANPQQRKLFLDSFCAALTLEEVREFCRAAGMPEAQVEMSSDRHYTLVRS